MNESLCPDTGARRAPMPEVLRRGTLSEAGTAVCRFPAAAPAETAVSAVSVSGNRIETGRRVNLHVKHAFKVSVNVVVA
ncbi:hypothetical protein [Pseudomonas sp. CGJS7]|uniref:hypothetical protein n=1 Tax=Pseudomonas sp. CGJS7 TaxID=3109348 RepID=UPI00300A3CED